MKQDKEEIKFRKDIVSALVESAFIYGLITEKDFDNRDILLDKVRKGIPKKDSELFFTIVHHPDLLERAEDAVKNNEWNYVYVYYATYFEHFINDILCVWAVKQKKPHKVIKELIRKVSIEDKYSWVLELLNAPKFNTKHLKIIKKLSENRNSFLHYKFEPEAANEPAGKEQKEWNTMSRDVKKAVIYSKKYRSKFVWNGINRKKTRF